MVLFLAYSVVEFLLGKSKRIRANSALEMLGIVILGAGALIVERIKNGRSKN